MVATTRARRNKLSKEAEYLGFPNITAMRKWRAKEITKEVRRLKKSGKI